MDSSEVVFYSVYPSIDRYVSRSMYYQPNYTCDILVIVRRIIEGRRYLEHSGSESYLAVL